jgi:hypothetical protein
VVDFDEFLYCKGEKNNPTPSTAHDQMAFFRKMMERKHAAGIQQLVIPQRVVFNRTGKIIK